MKLNPEYNYIVSGLERSGTSMLMQALYAGGFPIAFDESRKPDENNPKGYFELEGGKIINRLMEGAFPFEKYRGIFIKITAYGLKFLPTGRYKVIYSERDIEEILDSMEKMMGGKDKD
ncbi:MAG TPA: nucleotide pyrophosphatase, partial [Thermoplasmatales archaeon]|nr:nucleotide pyrophosphatase [Thermoplasmatales archaeon]